MAIKKAPNISALPRLTAELTNEQADVWRKHAILLAGQAASVDRTDQLAAILAESPHLNRLADQFADDVPVLVAGNWKDILTACRQDWQAACLASQSEPKFLPRSDGFVTAHIWHCTERASGCDRYSAILGIANTNIRRGRARGYHITIARTGC